MGLAYKLSQHLHGAFDADACGLWGIGLTPVLNLFDAGVTVVGHGDGTAAETQFGIRWQGAEMAEIMTLWIFVVESDGVT